MPDRKKCNKKSCNKCHRNPCDKKPCHKDPCDKKPCHKDPCDKKPRHKPKNNNCDRRFNHVIANTYQSKGAFYYVSAKHGNNQNNGTKNAQWRDINYGLGKTNNTMGAKFYLSSGFYDIKIAEPVTTSRDLELVGTVKTVGTCKIRALGENYPDMYEIIEASVPDFDGIALGDDIHFGIYHTLEKKHIFTNINRYDFVLDENKEFDLVKSMTTVTINTLWNNASVTATNIKFNIRSEPSNCNFIFNGCIFKEYLSFENKFKGNNRWNNLSLNNTLAFDKCRLANNMPSWLNHTLSKNTIVVTNSVVPGDVKLAGKAMDLLGLIADRIDVSDINNFNAERVFLFGSYNLTRVNGVHANIHAHRSTLNTCNMKHLGKFILGCSNPIDPLCESQEFGPGEALLISRQSHLDFADSSELNFDNRSGQILDLKSSKLRFDVGSTFMFRSVNNIYSFVLQSTDFLGDVDLYQLGDAITNQRYFEVSRSSKVEITKNSVERLQNSKQFTRFKETGFTSAAPDVNNAVGDSNVNQGQYYGTSSVIIVVE